MPLVLVHNEVVRDPKHAWDDVEGVHYHYPNKYKGKVTTGEPFVYYRGVAREGGKRGPAEYVGAGRIGRIWPDPNTVGQSHPAWYCAIEQYRRFAEPVPAKVDGVTLEAIEGNAWWDGIRVLDPLTHDRILSLAGPTASASVSPGEVVITGADSLIVPPVIAAQVGDGRTSFGRTRRAKEIGDWAEKVAVQYIGETVPGARKLVHRAAAKETPGWDVDYFDEAGVLQRVEVKGTVAAAFTGVELTANEMRAAKAHGPNYWLCLVGSCLTGSPKVQLIRNPAAILGSGEWSAIPALFSIRFARP